MLVLPEGSSSCQCYTLPDVWGTQRQAVSFLYVMCKIVKKCIAIVFLNFCLFVMGLIGVEDENKQSSQHLAIQSCDFALVSEHLYSIVPLLLKSWFGLWNEARWRRELRKPQKMCKSRWNAGYRRQKSQAKNVAVLWELDKKESRDQTLIAGELYFIPNVWLT